MKSILLLFTVFFVAQVRAGGPAVEMREARVDAIEQTAAGWIATVTGPVDVFVVDGEDPSRGSVAHLFADKARLQVPMGNQLYALSLKGSPLYEKRLKAAVGTKVFIQMWGANVVLEGGRVVGVTAGDISLLRPTREEAAFDLARLGEIQTR